MTDKEKILAFLEGMSKGCCPNETKEIIINKIIPWINSLPEKPVSEQPEYSFIETIYNCGKKSRWNIGDTLAYYECTSNCEGERVLGKITDVELDEEIEDWLYTFENGYQEEEESLLSNNAYKKN